MLDSIRKQLTNWFVILFLILYGVGGILGLFIFDSVLTAQLDEDVRALTSEIIPSVEFEGDRPTLTIWAANMQKEQQVLIATIQLFSSQGKLLERYGPHGISKLGVGTLTESDGHQRLSVRSAFVKLKNGDAPNGFLQVQVSTKHRDDALQECGLTIAILAPFFGLAVWLTGFFFSAKAVKPVAATLDLLRRFVADAGHELNTPITVIEASIQTLDATFAERGIPSDVLEVITRASARMKDLSANLMLLARMENPELYSKRTPLNLSEFLVPLLKEFDAIAERKNIVIRQQIPSSVVILGHADSLRTMISNLLENALRYTEPGGEVTLILKAQETCVVFSVEDNGIGIPADSLQHIFERFYRVDKSRSRAQGGSGLGLSIVKAIVEAHKGIIKVESHLGAGSKFTVTLPARS